MRRIKFAESVTLESSPALVVQRLTNQLSGSGPKVEPPSAKKLGGLVLTRHLGESIMIGDLVEVEVVGLKSGTARLKVVAPRSVPVHRREVYDQIQENMDSQPFAPTETLVNPPGVDRPEKPKGGLVLSRNVLQSIMIGDEVCLTVVEVRPTTVRIKVVAPRSVSVHRREIYEAIHGVEG